MAVCPHKQTNRDICLYQNLTWDPFLTSLENQLLENLSSQTLCVCGWRQTSKIWKVQSLYTKGVVLCFLFPWSKESKDIQSSKAFEIPRIRLHPQGFLWSKLFKVIIFLIWHQGLLDPIYSSCSFLAHSGWSRGVK